ncbi:MAG: tetrathionate reductase family octaheme c-type cytochrome [Syntrophales bacterium]|nr:tetrathionate reductase family octaheme c-type cytochrome [Syntrophales bacterium]MDD4338879.1 tetrathionate reductase family octaheme c-type cytochrome [Syntrophales bacterium]HOG08365.1 tetrathionate reductase family octaheme c-type cytochrome [Syntrophales bacterium]HOS77784.1 tetrathionate reductase family octaheme c-type cytochrome [Syntrophales bacterium]HPB69615.1 tetrathionate reductase family octaheme c-type cytochrome [Syntrophales bacterium]
MRTSRWAVAFSLLSGIVLASAALAGHVELVGKGPFKSGPEVTKKCIECHEKETRDFMKTVHWTWTKEQKWKGKTVNIGKLNALNNFCIGLPGNWPRCTSCHAGYGFKDESFDFSKAENVDCLVCHDTTGAYKKFPTAAGHPAYAGEAREFPKGTPWPPADLLKVAQSVGPTSRTTCGACHFYGGGGDHVKHGDLDTSMAHPSPEIDIHMGGKSKMTCQACHQAKDHFLKGEAASVTLTHTHPSHIDCVDCHTGNVHRNFLVNKHTERVACQSCHIPTFAKARPTKTWWDWSTAGKDIKAEDIPKDQYGMKLYDKMKGDFKWDKDVMPTYLWFNGNIERYHAGDKIDPTKAVKLTHVTGGRNDPHSKIYPFKIMRGKQAYDRGNNTIAYVRVFGPPGSDAYWQKYDWDRAIASGMKAAGQPYSGRFGFVETTMIWPVHHMVVSRDRSLKCGDCHGENGRFDWKALGYKGDPRDPKNR